MIGYPANNVGVIQPGAATPMQLPTAGINPAATSKMNIEFNLDARAKSTTPLAGAPINFTDPSTYNNATSMTAFDAKGQDVAITYYFQKGATDAANNTTWNVFTTANGVPFPNNGAVPPLPTAPPSLVMVFPPNGRFGQSNTTPRFMITDVRLMKYDVVGESHLRCFFKSLDRSSLQVMAWRVVGTPLGDFLMTRPQEALAFVGTLKKDTWMGRTRIQCTLDDVALQCHLLPLAQSA